MAPLVLNNRADLLPWIPVTEPELMMATTGGMCGRAARVKLVHALQIGLQRALEMRGVRSRVFWMQLEGALFDQDVEPAETPQRATYHARAEIGRVIVRPAVRSCAPRRERLRAVASPSAARKITALHPRLHARTAATALPIPESPRSRSLTRCLSLSEPLVSRIVERARDAGRIQPGFSDAGRAAEVRDSVSPQPESERSRRRVLRAVDAIDAGLQPALTLSGACPRAGGFRLASRDLHAPMLKSARHGRCHWKQHADVVRSLRFLRAQRGCIEDAQCAHWEGSPKEPTPMIAAYLYLNSALYALFALWCTLQWKSTSANLGYVSLDNSGRSEYLVIYGGLQWGLTVSFFWLANDPALRVIGLGLRWPCHSIVMYRLLTLGGSSRSAA